MNPRKIESSSSSSLSRSTSGDGRGEGEVEVFTLSRASAGLIWKQKGAAGREAKKIFRERTMKSS